MMLARQRADHARNTDSLVKMDQEIHWRAPEQPQTAWKKVDRWNSYLDAVDTMLMCIDENAWETVNIFEERLWIPSSVYIFNTFAVC